MKIQDKDMGWVAIKHAREELANFEVAIGILGADAIREHPEGDLTIAEAAVVNEFGSDDGVIPERGAHRLAFDINKAELNKRIEKTPELVDRGILEPKQALDLLGLWHADNIKDEIRAFDDPGNADSTIEQKGADNPLINEGRTINSVMHETRFKGTGPRE